MPCQGFMTFKSCGLNQPKVHHISLLSWIGGAHTLSHKHGDSFTYQAVTTADDPHTERTPLTYYININCLSVFSSQRSSRNLFCGLMLENMYIDI